MRLRIRQGFYLNAPTPYFLNQFKNHKLFYFMRIFHINPPKCKRFLRNCKKFYESFTLWCYTSISLFYSILVRYSLWLTQVNNRDHSLKKDKWFQHLNSISKVKTNNPKKSIWFLANVQVVGRALASHGVWLPWSLCKSLRVCSSATFNNLRPIYFSTVQIVLIFLILPKVQSTHYLQD